MRKRNQLVGQRSRQILSIENVLSRDTGGRASANEIKRWQETDVDQLALAESSRLAVKSNLAVMHCLNEQIEKLEAEILKKAKLRPDYQGLLTVSGVGKVLALTLALETGEVSRFATVGDFSSYCRCVGSEHRSNGKKKGNGNVKNGNSTWRGPLSKRRISPCVTSRRSSASINASVPRRCPWWRSRRWRTNWRGPVTT